MSTDRPGIVMHGVTVRMGLNQHRIRSIVAIREQGVVPLSDGRRVMPDPILVGRGAERMRALAAERAGVRHGVLHDKLWLPGLLKLKRRIESGFFGRILSVRGEFGYWVFEGDLQPAQRPGWNDRREDGGGIILDRLCNWRSVIDHLFGETRSVSCLGATHLPRRSDEAGLQSWKERRRVDLGALPA